MDAAGHLSAGQIAERVRREHPEIDFSTVYRTLSVGECVGLISRFDQAGKETEFEWVRRPHHHLVCRRCHRVLTLSEKAVEEFASLVRDETAFAADLQHLAISGVCGSCREKVEPDSPDKPALRLAGAASASLAQGRWTEA
jgi:Fur family ferric uptake transcriptional regulator